jgi:hypothetical protein
MIPFRSIIVCARLPRSAAPSEFCRQLTPCRYIEKKLVLGYMLAVGFFAMCHYYSLPAIL